MAGSSGAGLGRHGGAGSRASDSLLPRVQLVLHEGGGGAGLLLLTGSGGAAGPPKGLLPSLRERAERERPGSEVAGRQAAMLQVLEEQELELQQRRGSVTARSQAAARRASMDTLGALAAEGKAWRYTYQRAPAYAGHSHRH